MQNFENIQLAKLIYQKWLSNMKFTLDLEEQKYEDGRNNPKFKFFKKMLMEDTYKKMTSLFEELADLGVVQKTNDNEDLAHGYQPTASGGSGYINTEEFDAWLNCDNIDNEDNEDEPDENIGNK